MPADPAQDARSTKHAGAASGGGPPEAGAIQPTEGDCAGAEPSGGIGEARGGRDQETRSASGTALQQDRGASGGAGRVLPQSGRSVAGVHERRRSAATAAESGVPAAAGAGRGRPGGAGARGGGVPRGPPGDGEYQGGQTKPPAGVAGPH